MSHSQPVTAALYNPLFKQVVSVAADSTVAVWTMVTGHKAMQFRVQAASSHSESNYIEVISPGKRPSSVFLLCIVVRCVARNLIFMKC